MELRTGEIWGHFGKFAVFSKRRSRPRCVAMMDGLIWKSKSRAFQNHLGCWNWTLGCRVMKKTVWHFCKNLKMAPVQKSLTGHSSSTHGNFSNVFWWLWSYLAGEQVWLVIFAMIPCCHWLAGLQSQICQSAQNGPKSRVLSWQLLNRMSHFRFEAPELKLGTRPFQNMFASWNQTPRSREICLRPKMGCCSVAKWARRVCARKTKVSQVSATTNKCSGSSFSA